MREFLVPAADLLVGAVCAGCGRPAWLLCAPCRESIRPTPQIRRPDPVPAAMARTDAWAAGDNADRLRRVLLAWKEHGATRLTDVLDLHLAAAVVPHADRRALALVPVPTSERSRRIRGADLVRDLATSATRRLRRVGLDVIVVPALTHARVTQDQAGLGVEARRANLAGAYRPRRTGRLEGRDIVVVDDIMTTGSTAAEALRALSEAGHRPVGVSVVAATPRIAGAGR